MPLRKFTLQSKINLAFAVAGILFLTLFYSIYSVAETVRRNRDIMMETNNVNNVLEKILSSTIDIETGARGYTITGEENFLNAYKSGSRDLDMWLDSLSDMNPSAHGGKAKIDSLRNMVNSRRKIADLVVETRRLIGEDAADAIVATGEGKVLMDRIREYVQKFQSDQMNLLSSKLSETNESIRVRDRLFVVFVVCTFTLGFFGYVKIRRTAVNTMRSEHIQRKLSHKMAMQNRQLNDFANITSHNLRSPAANIASLVDIINEHSTIDDYKMVFEMMKKVSVNLNDTLNELIEVLHIKKNTTIEKEFISLQDTFNMVTDTLQGQIISKDATLTADFSQASHVRFPKIYIESILQNLISNALKYSSPERKPEVHLSSTNMAHYVKLTVKDNGLGIDLSKYGHKIFGMHQIFHRNSDAKGLGLFMTKTQVEALGGKISVESDGLTGSTFIVQFPL